MLWCAAVRIGNKNVYDCVKSTIPGEEVPVDELLACADKILLIRDTDDIDESGETKLVSAADACLHVIEHVAPALALSGLCPRFDCVVATICPDDEPELATLAAVAKDTMTFEEAEQFASELPIITDTLAKYRVKYYMDSFRMTEQIIGIKIANAFHERNYDIVAIQCDVDPFMNLIVKPVPETEETPPQIFDHLAWKIELLSQNLIVEIQKGWIIALKRANFDKFGIDENTHTLAMSELMEWLGLPQDAKAAYEAGVPIADIMA